MSPAHRHKFFTGFIFSYAILIIFIDQLSKFFICRIFTPLQSLPVIKSIFHITLVFNKGGAFGIFANAASVFIFISVVAIVAMLVFLVKGTSGYDVKATLGCITGGAVSNLIDRLRFGYVVDFLDFRIWPVFNIADTAITLGTIWLIYRVIVRDCEPRLVGAKQDRSNLRT